MAVLVYSELPFGLRSAALSPLTVEPSTYGAKVDVPRIQNIEMAEEEDSTEMNAADVRVAVHTFATRGTGSITAGGMNLDTLALLTGGSVSAAVGSSPNRVVTFARTSTQTKKYFKMEGQIYGDDAGDLHMIWFKVKCSGGPTFAANQGEFMVLTGDLEGVFTSETPGKLYTLIANETVIAIA
jgi:hypothetical protein